MFFTELSHNLKAYQYYTNNEHKDRCMPKHMLLAKDLSLCFCICFQIRPLRPSELTLDISYFKVVFSNKGISYVFSRFPELWVDPCNSSDTVM
jgi:hypothetical protein